LFCELCGKPLHGNGRKVMISGAILVVCDECAKYGVPVVESKRRSKSASPVKSRKFRGSPRRRKEVEYELVENYKDRIRVGREALGWTKELLAERIKEKVSVIRRIESGGMVPSLELARKLEKVLKISLLEPVVDFSQSKRVEKKSTLSLTLGDVADVKFKRS